MDQQEFVVEPQFYELNKEEIEFIIGNETKKARADISILDFNGFQKSSFFNICVVWPTCDFHIENEISKVIAKSEKRKNDTYANRIKEQIGGDFYPCILTSGGAMSPLAKKIMQQLAKEISVDSFIKEAEIAEKIKDDISKSLTKLKMQRLRCNRNSIASQISKFKTIE